MSSIKKKSESDLPISEVCCEEQMGQCFMEWVLKYVLIKFSVHEIVLITSGDEM